MLLTRCAALQCRYHRRTALVTGERAALKRRCLRSAGALKRPVPAPSSHQVRAPQRRYLLRPGPRASQWHLGSTCEPRPATMRTVASVHSRPAIALAATGSGRLRQPPCCGSHLGPPAIARATPPSPRAPALAKAQATAPDPWSCPSPSDNAWAAAAPCLSRAPPLEGATRSCWLRPPLWEGGSAPSAAAVPSRGWPSMRHGAKGPPDPAGPPPRSRTAASYRPGPCVPRMCCSCTPPQSGQGRRGLAPCGCVART